jgi:hypothetical protein
MMNFEEKILCNLIAWTYTPHCFMHYVTANTINVYMFKTDIFCSKLAKKQSFLTTNQEILHILWNLEAQYLVHMGPLLVPVHS